MKVQFTCVNEKSTYPIQTFKFKLYRKVIVKNQQEVTETEEYLQDARTLYGCAAKTNLENIFTFKLCSYEPTEKVALAPSVDTPLFEIKYSIRAFIQLKGLFVENRQGTCIEFPIILAGQPQ